MPKPVDLISSAEVAQRLGCDVRTVHRKVLRGQLTPLGKIDGLRGAYLFDAAEVARLITPEDAEASA
jgi:hypothetical protein